MKKLLSTTLAVGIFASMSLTPVYALDAGALPNLNSATNAKVTTDDANHNMNVQVQGGQGGVGDLLWHSFDVGKDSTVNFEFTAHNQTALNRVEAAGGMSEIYGNITNSSCPQCGYDYASTGKVILINPNGVLFGSTANVNLNSITVTNMDAQFDKDSNTLKLTKKAQPSASGRGIEVWDGAKITGKKGVTLAADNKVLLYKGSLISTDTAINNVDGDPTGAYGKVKIVTADGVNFVYYPNGAVKEIPNSSLKASKDQMTIAVNGEINSGNIDIRNYSSNQESVLSVNGAKLKATKAIAGNDGNIWLTASNQVNIYDSSITTEEGVGTEGVAGGNVLIQSGRNASVAADITSAGDITVNSSSGNAVVGGSTITAAKDLTVTAAKSATIQTYDKDSTVKAKNVTVNGKGAAGIQSGKVDADDVTVEGGIVAFQDADITAKGTINVKSTNGDITGSANLNGSKAKLNSSNDINVQLEGVGNSEKGLVAVAEQNLSIETKGDLSISALAAKHGDMHLKSNKLVMGKDYVNPDWQIEKDGDRSFIYVLEGEFDSVDNNGQENFTVTKSDKEIENNQFQARHHIEGKDNTSDKFVLINKRPYKQPPIDEPAQPEKPSIVYAVDDTQAKYLNKMPRQPEIFNNKTVVNDGRTALVDVFAAASQIEVEDDEEK